MTRFALVVLGSVGLAACQTGGAVIGNDTAANTDTSTQSTVDTAWTPTCTSGSHWSFGNAGSDNMHPGQACISCHQGGEGPNFRIAGTVMGDFHDEDDCNGVQGVIVHITDANGTVHDLSANRAGNFSSRTSIPLPYTAIVEYQGRSVSMITPQSSGDCNSCHTVAGANGAPGRIVAP